MKNIFITKLSKETYGEPVLPPMEADTGSQLHYTKDGKVNGGYSIVEFLKDGTVKVEVDIDNDTAVKMKKDNKYTFIKAVAETGLIASY